MKQKLSIIIPAFNEEKTIVEVINTVRTQEFEGWDQEIIVVDDGSTDATAEKIVPFQNKILFLKHATNRGKGAAIQTALKVVSGDAVVIQDADLEYNPVDIVRVLKEFGDQGVQVVYGSRYLNKKKVGAYPHYVFGARLLTFFTNMLFSVHLSDIYTGCKLFRAPILKSILLTSRGFEFEAEITTKILKKGIAIKEVAIDYHPRSFKEGKKIRFKDGLIGLWVIIKNRL